MEEWSAVENGRHQKTADQLTQSDSEDGLDPETTLLCSDIVIKQEPAWSEEGEEYMYPEQNTGLGYGSAVVGSQEVVWYAYQCRSGETLFYYNILTGEHILTRNSCTCNKIKKQQSIMPTSMPQINTKKECGLTIRIPFDYNLPLFSEESVHYKNQRSVGTETDVGFVLVSNAKWKSVRTVGTETEFTLIDQKKSFRSMGTMTDSTFLDDETYPRNDYRENTGVESNQGDSEVSSHTTMCLNVGQSGTKIGIGEKFELGYTQSDYFNYNTNCSNDSPQDTCMNVHVEEDIPPRNGNSEEGIPSSSDSINQQKIKEDECSGETELHPKPDSYNKGLSESLENIQKVPLQNSSSSSENENNPNCTDNENQDAEYMFLGSVLTSYSASDENSEKKLCRVLNVATRFGSVSESDELCTLNESNTEINDSTTGDFGDSCSYTTRSSTQTDITNDDGSLEDLDAEPERTSQNSAEENEYFEDVAHSTCLTNTGDVHDEEGKAVSQQSCTVVSGTTARGSPWKLTVVREADEQVEQQGTKPSVTVCDDSEVLDEHTVPMLITEGEMTYTLLQENDIEEASESSAIEDYKEITNGNHVTSSVKNGELQTQNRNTTLNISGVTDIPEYQNSDSIQGNDVIIANESLEATENIDHFRQSDVAKEIGENEYLEFVGDVSSTEEQLQLNIPSMTTARIASCNGMIDKGINDSELYGFVSDDASIIEVLQLKIHSVTTARSASYNRVIEEGTNDSELSGFDCDGPATAKESDLSIPSMTTARISNGMIDERTNDSELCGFDCDGAATAEKSELSIPSMTTAPSACSNGVIDEGTDTIEFCGFNSDVTSIGASTEEVLQLNVPSVTTTRSASSNGMMDNGTNDASTEEELQLNITSTTTPRSASSNGKLQLNIASMTTAPSASSNGVIDEGTDNIELCRFNSDNTSIEEVLKLNVPSVTTTRSASSNGIMDKGTNDDSTEEELQLNITSTTTARSASSNSMIDEGTNDSELCGFNSDGASTEEVPQLRVPSVTTARSASSNGIVDKGTDNALTEEELQLNITSKTTAGSTSSNGIMDKGTNNDSTEEELQLNITSTTTARSASSNSMIDEGTNDSELCGFNSDGASTEEVLQLSVPSVTTARSASSNGINKVTNDSKLYVFNSDVTSTKEELQLNNPSITTDPRGSSNGIIDEGTNDSELYGFNSDSTSTDKVLQLNAPSVTTARSAGSNGVIHKGTNDSEHFGFGCDGAATVEEPELSISSMTTAPSGSSNGMIDEGTNDIENYELNSGGASTEEELQINILSMTTARSSNGLIDEGTNDSEVSGFDCDRAAIADESSVSISSVTTAGSASSNGMMDEGINDSDLCGFNSDGASTEEVLQLNVPSVTTSRSASSNGIMDKGTNDDSTEEELQLNVTSTTTARSASSSGINKVTNDSKLCVFNSDFPSTKEERQLNVPSAPRGSSNGIIDEGTNDSELCGFNGDGTSTNKVLQLDAPSVTTARSAGSNGMIHNVTDDIENCGFGCDVAETAEVSELGKPSMTTAPSASSNAMIDKGINDSEHCGFNSDNATTMEESELRISSITTAPSGSSNGMIDEGTNDIKTCGFSSGGASTEEELQINILSMGIARSYNGLIDEGTNDSEVSGFDCVGAATAEDSSLSIPSVTTAGSASSNCMIDEGTNDSKLCGFDSVGAATAEESELGMPSMTTAPSASSNGMIDEETNDSKLCAFDSVGAATAEESELGMPSITTAPSGSCNGMIDEGTNDIENCGFNSDGTSTEEELHIDIPSMTTARSSNDMMDEVINDGEVSRFDCDGATTAVESDLSIPSLTTARRFNGMIDEGTSDSELCGFDNDGDSSEDILRLNVPLVITAQSARFNAMIDVASTGDIGASDVQGFEQSTNTCSSKIKATYSEYGEDEFLASNFNCKRKFNSQQGLGVHLEAHVRESNSLTKLDEHFSTNTDKETNECDPSKFASNQSSIGEELGLDTMETTSYKHVSDTDEIEASDTEGSVQTPNSCTNKNEASEHDKATVLASNYKCRHCKRKFTTPKALGVHFHSHLKRRRTSLRKQLKCLAEPKRQVTVRAIKGKTKPIIKRIKRIQEHQGQTSSPSNASKMTNEKQILENTYESLSENHLVKTFVDRVKKRSLGRRNKSGRVACKWCGKKYRYPALLVKHIATHNSAQAQVDIRIDPDKIGIAGESSGCIDAPKEHQDVDSKVRHFFQPGEAKEKEINNMDCADHHKRSQPLNSVKSSFSENAEDGNKTFTCRVSGEAVSPFSEHASHTCLEKEISDGSDTEAVEESLGVNSQAFSSSESGLNRSKSSRKRKNPYYRKKMRKFRCKVCNKRYHIAARLERHYLSVHGGYKIDETEGYDADMNGEKEHEKRNVLEIPPTTARPEFPSRPFYDENDDMIVPYDNVSGTSSSNKNAEEMRQENGMQTDGTDDYSLDRDNFGNVQLECNNDSSTSECNPVSSPESKNKRESNLVNNDFDRRDVVQENVAEQTEGLCNDTEGKAVGCTHCNNIFDSPLKLAIHRCTKELKVHNQVPENSDNTVELSISECPDKGEKQPIVQENVNNSSLSTLTSRKYSAKSSQEYQANETSPMSAATGQTHQNSKALQCRLCFKKFRKHTTLLDHLKKHKKMKRHICRHCSKTFQSYSYLISHLDAHEGMKYTCKECGKQFSYASNLYAHKRQWHSSGFFCRSCSNVFLSKASFQNHKCKSDPKGKRYIYCKDCGIPYQRFSALEKHMAVHKSHSSTLNDGKCPPKEKVSSRCNSTSTESLDDGLAKKERFSCHLCEFSYASWESLQSHLVKHKERSSSSMPLHSSVATGLPNDDSFHKSEIVEDESSIEENIETALDIVSPSVKKRKCDFCPATYRTPGNLAKHLNTHGQNKKKFQCDYCGISYVYQGRLENHMRSHMAVVKSPLKRRRGQERIPSTHQSAMNKSGKVFSSDSEFASTRHDSLMAQKSIKSSLTEESQKVESYFKEFLPCEESEESASDDGPLKKKRKKFKCDQCDAAYVYQGCLDNHMNTHETNTSTQSTLKSRRSNGKSPKANPPGVDTTSLNSEILDSSRISGSKTESLPNLVNTSQTQEVERDATANCIEESTLNNQSPKKFKCSFCDMSYVYAGRLKNHLKIHHVVTDTPLETKNLHSETEESTTRSLQESEDVPSNHYVVKDTPYKTKPSPLEPEESATRSLQDTLLETRHTYLEPEESVTKSPKELKNKFQCDYCGVSYVYQGRLVNHMRSHMAVVKSPLKRRRGQERIPSTRQSAMNKSGNAFSSDSEFAFTRHNSLKARKSIKSSLTEESQNVESDFKEFFSGEESEESASDDGPLKKKRNKFKCDQCDAEYVYEGCLDNHMNTHETNTSTQSILKSKRSNGKSPKANPPVVDTTALNSELLDSSRISGSKTESLPNLVNTSQTQEVESDATANCIEDSTSLNNQSPKKFKCSFCDMSYVYAGRLKNHLKIHHVVTDTPLETKNLHSETEESTTRSLQESEDVPSNHHVVKDTPHKTRPSPLEPEESATRSLQESEDLTSNHHGVNDTPFETRHTYLGPEVSITKSPRELKKVKLVMERGVSEEHYENTSSDDTSDEHLVKKYRCDHCDVAYANEGSLRDHLTKHDEPCSESSLHGCVDSSVTQAEPEAEVCLESGGQEGDPNDSTKRKPFRCHFCSVAYVFPGALNYHVKTQHSELPPPLAPRSCREKKPVAIGDSLEEEDVVRFLNTKLTEEKQFKCEFCGMTYSYAGILQKHLLVHKSMAKTSPKPNGSKDEDVVSSVDMKLPEEKQFTCEFCGVSYSYAASLQNHLLIHKSTIKTSSKPNVPKDKTTDIDLEKQYQCKLCDKSYVNRIRFLKHMDAHVSPLKYPKQKKATVDGVLDVDYDCATCGETFDHPDDLQKHAEEFHTVFVCKQCQRSFSSAVELTKHLRTHTTTSRKMKLFCQICGKGFNSTGQLILHFRSHGKDNSSSTRLDHTTPQHQPEKGPYTCAHCGLRFPKHTKLGTHVRYVHGKERKKNGAPSNDVNESRQAITDEPTNESDSLNGTTNHVSCTATGSQSVAVVQSPCETKEQFPCYYCDMSFMNPAQRSAHAQDMHQAMVTNCDVSETFSPNGSVVSSNEMNLSCSTSDCYFGATSEPRTASTSEDMIEAQQDPPNPPQAEEEGPYSCYDCGLLFKELSKMNVHAEYTHKDPKYECNICTRKFGGILAFLSHKKTCGKMEEQAPPEVLVHQVEGLAERGNIFDTVASLQRNPPYLVAAGSVQSQGISQEFYQT